METAFKRFGAWLLTNQGKKFVFGSATATTIVIANCFYIPHTFLLEQYKNFIHHYKHGFMCPVPKYLLERYERTLDLLEMPQYNRKRCKPFIIFGFDAFAAGSLFSRYGVIIGMPISFTHLDEDYVDKTGIQIVGGRIPWDMPEGRLLYKSLLIPEKAQMYAIAKELELRSTKKFLFDSFFPAAMFALCYVTGKEINAKFDLYAKSRIVRFPVYGVVGGVFLTSYFVIKDFVHRYNERRADDYLVAKNPIFREGGKEYFDLMVMRNLALRKILGKLGESSFNAHGNVNSFIRHKHMPILERQAFFKNTLEA